MILGLAYALVTGFLVKLTDFILDEPNRFKETPDAMIAAAAAGISGGMMLGSGAEFATLGLAIIAGVLLARKVDSMHQFTVAIAVVVMLILGIPEVNVSILIVFVVFGYLDEVIVGKYRKLAEKVKKIRIPKWKTSLIEERLLLLIAVTGVSIYFSNYTYLLAMLMFQVGYDLSRNMTKRVKFFTPQTSKGSS